MHTHTHMTLRDECVIEVNTEFVFFFSIDTDLEKFCAYLIWRKKNNQNWNCSLRIQYTHYTYLNVRLEHANLQPNTIICSWMIRLAALINYNLAYLRQLSWWKKYTNEKKIQFEFHRFLNKIIITKNLSKILWFDGANKTKILEIHAKIPSMVYCDHPLQHNANVPPETKGKKSYVIFKQCTQYLKYC